jgi:tetratricopeptide (TPR) repeat protein
MPFCRRVDGAIEKAADWTIAGEPLLFLVAIPLLIFPRGYLWQWQQGVYHYAPIEHPALRYPGLLSWIGLGLVALPWLARGLRHGRPSRPTALDVPLAVYLATAALSLWPSVDRAHSSSFLLVLVAGITVYYAVVNAVTAEARLGWAVGLYLAGGLALSIVGFLQIDWGEMAKATHLPVVYGWLQEVPHVLGRTLSRGITSGASMLFIPVGLALAFAAPRSLQRALIAAATLVMVALLVLSQSRGDILALALTVPAVGLWLLPGGATWLLSAVLGAYGALAGVVLFAPGLVSQVAHWYPSRWQVWERAAYIIRDHPFTGIGLDTFQYVARGIYPYFDHGWNWLPMAHNRLLQVGVDQGLVGLAAFVALVVLFYRANRRAWRAARTRMQRGLALGLCGGFTAFMLSSVLDDGVLTGRAGLAVWYLLGLGIAQARLLVKEPGRAAVPGVRLGRGAAVLGTLALCALALSPAMWHNLGNVARNRGWLAAGLAPETQQEDALKALSFYGKAGVRAARDRASLSLLAPHPRPPNQDSPFLQAVAGQVSAEEAVLTLESAAVRYPRDRFAHFYLGEAYRTAGRLEEAAAAYGRAGFPAGWAVTEARFRWDYGRGDYAEAVAQLTIATLMEPDSAEAYKALGQCHARAGDLTRAVEAYERALQLEPDDASIRQALDKASSQLP